MSTGINLPDELLSEILVRLPAKPLGRFKSVSKPWRALISHPNFIKSHLCRRSSHENIILTSGYHLIVIEFGGVEPFIRELHYLPPLYFMDIFSSCDGLVLAADGDWELFLLNPTTRSCKKLRPFSFEFQGVLRCRPNIHVCGIGYDQSTDDYKVFAMVLFWKDDYNLPIPYCYVYSLKSSCWKRVESSSYGDAYFRTNKKGVFLNGCFHFFGCCASNRWKILLLAFDLANEEFRVFPLPSEIEVGKNGCYGNIHVLGGCLSIDVYDPSNNQTYVWVMKEYGVESSWKMFSMDQTERWSHFPLYMLADEEYLLQMDWLAKPSLEKESKNPLMSYNVKDKTSKEFVINGLPHRLHIGLSFIESLVSPYCNNGIEGQCHNL